MTSNDSRIFHWSLAANPHLEEEEVQGHQGTILGAIHRDERFFTWAEDQWVIEWSSANGQEIERYRGLADSRLHPAVRSQIERKRDN